MADLIDRAALLEWIDKKFFATDPNGEEQLGYLNSRTLIRTAPTVDAVEVVRCEKCDFRKRTGRCCKSGLYMPDDGFCSFGERKET